MLYMVKNTLAQAPDEAFFASFPAEQARVAELMAEGILLGLYVAADYSGAWLVLRGESAIEVQDTVASLPLHAYQRSEITPLLDASA
jgi:muconolactone delta-isomerase